MKTKEIFGRLILTDLKRLKNYIVSILIATTIIMTICGIAGIFISKNIYKSGVNEIIGIGYYLPEDGKENMNNMGISMLQNMESMKDTAKLIEVDSPKEGYQLLDNEEILYLIIVPEKFISSIMNGTNTPLEIIVWDNSSVSSYIANEMFMSYAKYLGLAQSSVYSALDVARENDYSDEERKALRTTINMTFLDRALNKDSFFTTIDASKEGEATLIQHYLSAALMLSLFFMSFVLMPHLQGYNKSMLSKFNTLGINKLHIIASNIVSTTVALYVSYLPCFIGINVLNKGFNPLGLISIIPPIVVIATIISAIAVLTNNIFTANITVLVIGLVIAYIGGGILPSAMLPSIVQSLSDFMPGKFLITNIATSLFGF